MELENGKSKFQSTPPARGATGAVAVLENAVYISIHAPREGGDLNTAIATVNSNVFQSTPPARGATFHITKPYMGGKFQSTPPARGATVLHGGAVFDHTLISIHAPREGGDRRYFFMAALLFISIHAPREGGDSVS